ncbi:carboxymuconolactone decarboxylase family protein [Yinghuangia aomiensis]
MAPRIPLADLPADLEKNMIDQLGTVPEPVAATFHSPKVSLSSMEFGGKVAEWDDAEESLKSYAHMAVATQVGCGWCLDIGYFHALNQNLDLAKASQVPVWRDSDVFSPLERDVLEYAEAMTNTPPTVTDDMYAGLLDRVGAPAMVELTAYIAFVNMATRNNNANGISSQGFSDNCEIPLAKRPAAPAV